MQLLPACFTTCHVLAHTVTTSLELLSLHKTPTHTDQQLCFNPSYVHRKSFSLVQI